MSNIVMLTVGQFQALDGSSVSYGYTISDTYGRDYNFMWDTAEEFYRDNPTPASLWKDALSSDRFEDIDVMADDNGVLMIENDVPVREESCGASGFSLDGYHPSE